MKTNILLPERVFGESVRWHEDRCWFSDWGTQEIIAVDPQGRSETMVRLPFQSFPFCFDWLPDGRLLITSSSDQPLLRQEADGSFVSHADVQHLSPFGWNEIVTDNRGYAYLNCVDFDMMNGAPFQPGHIAVVAPDGSARKVAGDLYFPNGMIITSDHQTLIVAESYGKRLSAFDIAADGSLHNRRIWADLGNGVPDGICDGGEHTIWYADVPNKSCTRVREGGEVVESITLDQGCFSCASNGHQLFMATMEWKGPQQLFSGPRTGNIVMAEW
ncbi:SMP-30/gluconolactonase/LRE family protein [Chitinophaga vietnamensis]|uniref:SMP-30/gluconolactonase/LRE family protein n=1 Tax=Chitinophaga vietnamensis TaxID=2593957 RepID=UPI0011773B16|nr:SMP-30/gluconolactonase/LRE family protein [Chitinophaga vietnamensis]